MEEWKNIDECLGYKISNYGNVTHNNKKVGFIGSDNYAHVILKINGINKNIRIHKLVWKYFGNNQDDNLVIDHINNIKSDNRIENLQSISFRNNVHKDQKIGLSNSIGVSWSNDKKRWRSQISINNKRIHLGYRKTKIEAELLYQKALLTA